jgi:serpin B
LQAVSSKDGNVFISPVSAEVVLALAYMGAAGSTAKQIASALYLPPDRDDVKTGFAALLGSLKVRWTCFSVSAVMLHRLVIH